MLKSTLLFLFVAISLFAQSQQKYFIYFKDKGIEKGNVLNKELPQYKTALNMLSEKAIERREKAKNSTDIIDYTDIPVYSNYIKQIEQLGIKISNKLDWFNAVTAYLTVEQLNQVKLKPFVSSIEKVKTLYKKNIDLLSDKSQSQRLVPSISDSSEYGSSYSQNNLSDIIKVHNMNINGEGVIIGVLDSGFDWKNNNATKNMNILKEYDFVFGDNITANQDGDAASQHNHGTYVLSIIGGYEPNMMIGVAYKSKFILAKTEDVRSETRIEEDNYAAALQWMENLGIDIATSSLGYNEFDGGITYDYNDMDGNTTIVTKAAEIAFSKGVVTITSAGNEGDKGWIYITAPADGKNIISVGAVTADNQLAAFSSRGPSSDGRIKPEVTAKGVSVFGVAADNNAYQFTSGTSCAAPIVAGIAGLLLNAYPDLTNTQVRSIMLESGKNAATPNNEIGYGLLSALNAVCFPNIVSDGNSFIIRKRFPILDIQENSVVIKYQLKGDSLRTEFLNRNSSTNVYQFLVPSFESGKIINFSYSYKDSQGNVYNEPENGTFKFKYGFSIVANKLPLSGDDVTEDNVDLISQNYPNPFKDKTNIDFNVNSNLDVKISIYNVLGQKIIDLFNGLANEGSNTITWNGRDSRNNICSSGIYIVTIKNGSKTEAKKMVFLK